MPKATVNEQHAIPLSENYIRSSGQVYGMESIAITEAI
jgi:hypothetical protein